MGNWSYFTDFAHVILGWPYPSCRWFQWGSWCYPRIKGLVSRTQCNTTKEQVFKKFGWSVPATSRLYCPAIWGGGFKYFAFSPRKLGIHEPFLLAHIFQMGWFNSTANECMVNIQKVVKSNGKSDSQNGQKPFRVRIYDNTMSHFG